MAAAREGIGMWKDREQSPPNSSMRPARSKTPPRDHASTSLDALLENSPEDENFMLED